MHRVVLYSIIVCLSMKAYTQDSSRFFQLDTVRIVDHKLTTPLASNWLETSPSNEVSQTLTDQMAKLPVNVKNYGLNNIATLSMQGGSSYHTVFYWDEIPIQNPLNGVFDLSLIPGGLFDQIDLNTSNTSAHVGSGAISGSAALQSNEYKTKTVGWIRIESSKNLSLAFKHSKQHKKWSHYSAVIYQPEENEYTIEYQNTQKRKIIGARSEKWSYIQTVNLPISKKISIGAKTWINNSERNTPQNIFTNLSDHFTYQHDFWINSSVHALYQEKEKSVLVKYAYLHNRSLYQDAIREIDGNHKSQTQYSEIRYTHDLNKYIHVLFDLQYHQIKATSTNFKDIPLFTKLASIGGVNIKAKKTVFNVSFRKELNQKEWSPSLLSASVERTLKLNTFFAQISKNYRYPSLNDLYWTPGGNQLLQPEESLKEELGIRMQKKAWKSQVNLFHAHVKNWILWLPSGAYWSPQNILDVQNKGIETSFTMEHSLGEIEFFWNILTNTTFSTNKTKISGNNDSYNKQMIFTPFFNSNSTIEFRYKNWNIFALYQYNGKRYFTSDNSLYIPHYQVFSFTISKKWITKTPITTSITVHNALNTSYMIVPNSPLPLRYFSFQLLFQLKN